MGNWRPSPDKDKAGMGAIRGLPIVFSAGSLPVSVELSVDPHVYLAQASAIEDDGETGLLLTPSYLDGQGAVWRQVGRTHSTAKSLGLTIRWYVIANAAPGSHYRAALVLRDSAQRILSQAGSPGSAPSAALECVRRISRDGEPVDHAGASLLLRLCPSTPFKTEPEGITPDTKEALR